MMVAIWCRLDDDAIYGFAMQRDGHGLLWASTGLYRTADRGVSWERVPTGDLEGTFWGGGALISDMAAYLVARKGARGRPSTGRAMDARGSRSSHGRSSVAGRHPDPDVRQVSGTSGFEHVPKVVSADGPTEPTVPWTWHDVVARTRARARENTRISSSSGRGNRRHDHSGGRRSTFPCLSAPIGVAKKEPFTLTAARSWSACPAKRSGFATKSGTPVRSRASLVSKCHWSGRYTLTRSGCWCRAVGGVAIAVGLVAACGWAPSANAVLLVRNASDRTIVVRTFYDNQREPSAFGRKTITVVMAPFASGPAGNLWEPAERTPAVTILDEACNVLATGASRSDAGPIVLTPIDRDNRGARCPDRRPNLQPVYRVWRYGRPLTVATDIDRHFGTDLHIRYL